MLDDRSMLSYHILYLNLGSKSSTELALSHYYASDNLFWKLLNNSVHDLQGIGYLRIIVATTGIAVVEHTVPDLQVVHAAVHTMRTSKT